MIKTIIKRDKTEQAFTAEKLNGWGIWASKNLGHYVSWPEVVLATVSTLPNRCTSIMLQERLIKVCLDMDSYSYQRMAGRLYYSVLLKIIHPNGIPTVQELHKTLYNVGYMVKLNYSDAEYLEIEKIIDHSRNIEYAHGQLHHLREKYSLKNRVTGSEYETSQFVFMRMAMALGETQPLERRMDDVKSWYNHFSKGRINCPTPNYVNLGTPNKGYASCCLYTSGDSASSLAIGDHIAYTMTYSSAGIGSHLNVRSLGDPVKRGMISHQGKLPYYRAMVAAVTAQLQNGRGGACTTFYNLFDPEVEVISKLKNPKSTEDKQIRGMDYNAGMNNFFAKKAAANEEVFTFNSFTAPDLYQSLYDDSSADFEIIYNKYLNDKKFKKKFINAREVLLSVLNESYETGRAYLHFIEAMNKHTPFEETIYLSNLCFSGNTLVAVADMRSAVSIYDLAKYSNGLNRFNVHSSYFDTSKKIWVSEIKEAIAFKTGTTEVIELTLSDDSTFECTLEHKLALTNGEYIEAKRSIGASLQGFKINNLETDLVLSVTGIISKGSKDVYDLTVQDNHNFNIITKTTDLTYTEASGILVHNCAEIALPVQPYTDMQDLYSTEDHGNGEIGLCSLAGICPEHCKSDEEYASAAYYSLLMIDKCIHISNYVLPHLETTAKSRLSAGVSIIGLAHHMASNNKKYTTADGKQFIHDLAEKHYWYLLNASLKLGKELGNAPWMFKTKWPEGWTPLSTYNKNVDSLVTTHSSYDWESLSNDIKNNGGIRNSVLACALPSESSSKVSGTTNGVYPIRDYTLIKTDNSTVTYWAAKDGEKLKNNYEIAWDIPTADMIDCYAVIQKWTDQSISADLYCKVIGDTTISSSEMLGDFFRMVKYGMKTRYYQNSLTSEGVELIIESNCTNGVCSI